MTQTAFNAEVRSRPGLAMIDLVGEINAFAEEALNHAYSEAEKVAVDGEGNPAPIVLNFTQVNYINSTGIALIVGLLARARKARRRLAVFGLSEHYQEIFHITRLTDFMSIFPDEASAVQAAA